MPRAAAAQATADEHARNMLPVLRAIRAEGIHSIGAITVALDARKIPTPRGAQWQSPASQTCWRVRNGIEAAI